MDRKNIDIIAQTPEDKVLLAKVWDKITAGMQKNIPASTCFLSQRELEMTRYLFGSPEGLVSYGGWDEAQRRILVYLPEYLDENYLSSEDSPLACLHAEFYEGDNPTHRDFLGALMGAGIARETVGDILVGNHSCDFFVSAEIAPYLLQNFESAGRTKLSLKQISPEQICVPEPEIQEIRDTVASLRLDSVVSSGFRVSRGVAGQQIAAGRASINGLPCVKPDRLIEEGATIAVRGLGKIQLKTVNGQTKKGRISVVIHRYL